MSSTHSGFTTLELIITVMIIGIIAAVAVPTVVEYAWEVRSKPAPVDLVYFPLMVDLRPDPMRWGRCERSSDC